MKRKSVFPLFILVLWVATISSLVSWQAASQSVAKPRLGTGEISGILEDGLDQAVTYDPRGKLTGITVKIGQKYQCYFFATPATKVAGGKLRKGTRVRVAYKKLVTSEQDRGYFFTGDAVTITILAASVAPTAPTQTRDDIRQVDFKNFSYRLEGKLVQLKNGRRAARNDNEYSVNEVKVSYGDLTGDGQEEAIVILSYDGGGTGSFTFGYLYSIQNGRPVLLTTLKGGDRADGGLVSAKIANGLLIVERNVFDQGLGLCCPKYVETIHYKWDGARLVRANQAAQSASPNQPRQSLGQTLKSGIRDMFTGNKTDQPLTGTEVKMTAELKRTLNTFFSNFAETNLEPFETGRITDEALIQFGVLHNVINNPKLFEIVSGGENQRLAARHVEAAVQKYFGLRIGQHKSLSGNYSYIKYRNGFYYVPRASGEAYTFSQVTRLIDNGGTFTAYINVYVASSGSNINPQGTPAEWKKAGETPQLSAKMKATITTVNEGGRSRYMLSSYSTP